MQIKEILTSVENDGLNQGYLSTYIRTSSCNLTCTYCNEDCTNSEDYTVMSVEEILNIVYVNGYHHVCFLGSVVIFQIQSLFLILQLS